MSLPFETVRQAVGLLGSLLGLKDNPELQQEYENGMLPHLMAYEKSVHPEPRLRVIDRYIAAASSYLHQPCTYYDIYGACRATILTKVLADALEVLLSKQVQNIAPRLERLLAATDFDRFDAAAFELIVAARYAEHPGISKVEFVVERPPQMTPDLCAFSDSGALRFVECKKSDRRQDHSVRTRVAVRKLLIPLLCQLRTNALSAAVDISFHGDPASSDSETIIRSTIDALSTGTSIVEGAFTLSARTLPCWPTGSLTLYPSPEFAWRRYGFRGRSEWFGLVNDLIGSHAQASVAPKSVGLASSSWLRSIAWDAGIKWRITHEPSVYRYQRFPFDGIFRGLDQISGKSDDCALHFWLETDHYVGPRETSLRDLFNRIAAKSRDVFGWLVINETLFEASPMGRFDLIENAHLIRGPVAGGSEPIVSGVFGLNSVGPTAEFGRGTEMPDIDSL